MSSTVSLRAIRRAERTAQAAVRARRERVLPPMAHDVPKHVKHCWHNGGRDWWLWIWQKSEGARFGTAIRAQYCCRSWRCPGGCARHEAHVTFARIKQAFEPLPADGVCLLVLTLDRFGTYSGEQRWPTPKDAYQDLSRLSNEFLKRLRKWFKRMGWAPLGNRWTCTVEMHRSGWPHVNYVLHSRELADWIEAERDARLDDGMTPHEASLVSRELADIVTGSGWGLLSTAERARSADAVMSYIVKLAGECEQAIGELSKLTQLPLNAPFRFRRLRSGKGFLPPREKSKTMTGTLLRRRTYDGFLEVEPLHNIKDPVVQAMSSQCCAVEEDVWQSELEAKSRCARQVKQFGPSACELPPVTYWHGKRRLDRGPTVSKVRTPDDNRKRIDTTPHSDARWSARTGPPDESALAIAG